MKKIWLLNGDYFSGSLRSVVAVDGRGYTWQFGFCKEASTDNTSSPVDMDGYFKNVFNVFTGEITALNFMGCNPLMWGGANGNVHNITQLTGKGSYMFQNSYKKAVVRSAKGPLGVIGVGLSVASLGLTVIDMNKNGINISNSIDAVVASAGVFGGVAAFGVLGAGALACSPWVITAVTIYGVADFGVYIYTGHSITNW